MQKVSTVKELCEFIWMLENKYNLLDLEIDGVKPWQACRMEIYYELSDKCGIFKGYQQRKMSNVEKFFALFRMIVNSIFFNPFSFLAKKDSVVFSHSRSKMVDNEYVDIYTHYLLDDINKKQEKYLEFESHYKGTHIRKYNIKKRYLDYFELLKKIFLPFKKVDLKVETKEVILKAENEINSSLSIAFNLEAKLLQRTKKFLILYPNYIKLLKQIKPTTLYLVVSYGTNNSELIKAAKFLGIKVVELQHGTFSKYHLGYSFPNRKSELDYFPDEFWAWSDYWKKLIPFPLASKQVKCYPFKYLEIEKQKYPKNKISNQIVVLGQGGITDQIASIILDELDVFRGYKIIFKLHPEEYGKSTLYNNLNLLKERHDSIVIVENIELYELLAQSEYQAGVFSTALYEGIEFDCKTILFDLPGIEYMDSFIKFYDLKRWHSMYLNDSVIKGNND